MRSRAPSHLFLLGRAVVALVLLGLAASLLLDTPLAPGGEGRWIAGLVLGVGLADLALIAFEIWSGLRARETFARAVATALGIARQTGAVVSSAFAIAWLILRPEDPAAAGSFALLAGAGVLINAGTLRLGDRSRRRGVPQPGPRAVVLRRSRAQRRTAVLVSSAAVCGVLGIVGWQYFADAPPRELACPLLPNGVIPGSGLLTSRCPLEPLDRVVEVWVPGDRGPFRGLEDLREKAARWPEFVEWTVERGGQRVKAAIPVLEARASHPLGRFTTALLLAGIMLATALIIAWNTASAAAIPFLALYSLVSVWLTAALCAGSNEYLYLLAALGLAMFGSPLAHLALVFPREREGISGLPGLPALYYACGGLLCALMLFGFHASAQIWILMERLTLVFALVSWSAMLLSAIAVMHAPTSRIERERARITLTGSAGMVVLALAIGPLAGAHAEFAHRTATAVLLPVPVAAALVRYHVFDMHPRLWRVLSSLVYSGLAAGLLTLLAVLSARLQHTTPPLGDVGLLFSSLVVFLLATEPARGWLLGRARDLVSKAARRRRAAALHSVQQLAELRDPDACARILAQNIVESLHASWAVVFLRSRELGLRPAYAVGDGAPLSLDLARRADAFATPGSVIHLPRAEPCETTEVLARAGVDVVMPLSKGSAGTEGLVLLGERDEAVPYTLEELDSLVALGAQAGAALDNARLARELVDAERTAARGNIAVGLAHELGKPLRVIEDIARSLERDPDADPERARRQLGSIAAISKELIQTVYGFVQEARVSRVSRGAAVADVVARAVQTIYHLHGADRVSISLAPDLPEVAGGDELATVLANLLDNALLASRAGESVHVVASADGENLRLEVVDDGHGMDDPTAARAFELFFTTRAAQGGSGVGLALSREIIGHLGGSIELSSKPGSGTRVTLRLPGLSET